MLVFPERLEFVKENSSQQFEDALKRLEKIVDDLESGEVGLDEALKRYEEGIKLVRFCTKKLQDAEKKIEILCKDDQGNIVKKPFSSETQSQDTTGKESGEALLF